jgi:spore germination protein GerM
MTDRPGPFDPDPPDDEAARRLREVLSSEARAITPSPDGLSAIRDKIRARRTGRRSWLRAIQIGGAAVATAAIAIVAVVVLPHNSGSNGPTGQTGSSPSTSASPTATPSSSAASSAAGAPYPVWVYYVDKRKDPRQLLFRESTQWPSSPQHTFVKDAVSAMLATKAQDPDFTSYWPAGTTLLSATITGDTTAVVDLSAQAATVAAGNAGKADISVQQLLYTIHTAAPKIDALDLRVAGKPIRSLWGTPVTDPIALTPSADVFAHVWITSPDYNAELPSSFSFGGEATVFEANVTWELLQGGGVLRHGATTATIGAPGRGMWSVQLDGLAPGKYLLSAFEVSMKDGSKTFVDDKAITVK